MGEGGDDRVYFTELLSFGGFGGDVGDGCWLVLVGRVLVWVFFLNKRLCCFQPLAIVRDVVLALLHN